MADVTSSLIGKSINAINSWPAAAIRFLGCSGVEDRTTPSTPVLTIPSSLLTSRWSLCHLGLINRKKKKITHTRPCDNHLSMLQRNKRTMPCKGTGYKDSGEGCGDCQGNQEEPPGQLVLQWAPMERAWSPDRALDNSPGHSRPSQKTQTTLNRPVPIPGGHPRSLLPRDMVISVHHAFKYLFI